MTGARLRRRAALTAAAVAALALVVGLALQRSTADEALRPRSTSPAGPSDAAAPGGSGSPRGRAVPVPTTAHGAEERQICGGVWVKVGADGDIDGTPPDDSPEIEASRLQTIARLRADPDAYSRAVATWLTSDDPAALVGAASSTRDPRVYALAFQSCRRATAGNACGLLSAGQWARLDPGNAAPWLFALDDATTHQDAAGVDEALFQIGQAQRSESRTFLPALPVLDGASSGEASAVATFGLATRVIGMVLALPSANLATVKQACHGPALADANRRQVCERAADVLVDRSDNLLTRSIAARVATELSGSPARYDMQRAEMRAYSDANDDATTFLDAFSCKSIRRTLDRLREQALYGEVGAVRRWVAQSGLTPRDLLDRSLAFDARFAAAAASAVRAARPEAEAVSAPASAP